MIDKALEVEILRLHSVEKWKVGTIASQLHVHHETVERVIAQGGLTPERSSNTPTIIQPYMQFVVAKLEQYPRRIPGWPGPLSALGRPSSATPATGSFPALAHLDRRAGTGGLGSLRQAHDR